MVHQQNAIELFELSRDQHQRLLAEATQNRLLNGFKQETTTSSNLFRWLLGRKQTEMIQEVQPTIIVSVN